MGSSRARVRLSFALAILSSSRQAQIKKIVPQKTILVARVVTIAAVSLLSVPKFPQDSSPNAVGRVKQSNESGDLGRIKREMKVEFRKHINHSPWVSAIT